MQSLINFVIFLTIDKRCVLYLHIGVIAVLVMTVLVKR